MTGAYIERGAIIEVIDFSPEDAPLSLLFARVESMTRPGAVTPFLPLPPGRSAQPGQCVYFFMFSDGDGRIIM